MADLLRWFKVWVSILDDPHFQELPLEQIGRWVLLGAMTASVGSGGKLTIPGGGRRLCELLRVDTLEAAKKVISDLPNVLVEEGQNRHGGMTVTWKNWTKFQRDSTQAQRAKASRSKRRGEEIRGEKKYSPPALSSLTSAHNESASGPSVTWSTYLTSLGESDRQVLTRVAEAFALTRKAGRVTTSVLDSLARKLTRYPVAAVVRAAQIYVDRGYADEGKDERYLLGIVRGEAKRPGGEAASAPALMGHNGGSRKTPGQRAIERALREQEQGA